MSAKYLQSQIASLAKEIGFHKADESHVGKEFRFHVNVLLSKAIEELRHLSTAEN